MISPLIRVLALLAIALLAAGDATLWLGGRRSLGDSGSTSFFVPPRAETEPRWSGSVRIGLRLRL